MAVITSIHATYGRRWNLDDYESATVNLEAFADVEEGETPEQAAVREAYEELGVEVELGRLVADLTYRDERQCYFLARIVGGEFGTGTGEEMSSTLDSPNGTYTPVWLPLAEALRRDTRPIELCELLQAQGPEPEETLVLTWE